MVMSSLSVTASAAAATIPEERALAAATGFCGAEGAMP
jgi:hypothetical protein